MTQQKRRRKFIFRKNVLAHLARQIQFCDEEIARLEKELDAAHRNLVKKIAPRLLSTFVADATFCLDLAIKFNVSIVNETTSELSPTLIAHFVEERRFYLDDDMLKYRIDTVSAFLKTHPISALKTCPSPWTGTIDSMLTEFFEAHVANNPPPLDSILSMR